MTCPNGCDGNGCKIIGTGGTSGTTCNNSSYIESCSGNTVLYCPQSTSKVAAITCPSGTATCDVIMNSGYADCFSESSKCTSVGATKQHCSDGYITNYVCSVSAKGELYWAPVSIEPCDNGNGYCTAEGTCHTAQTCGTSYTESCTDNLLMYCSNDYVSSLTCSDSVPCRINKTTHDASCAESCTRGAADKITCYEQNGKTMALTYSCQATTANDYGYFLDKYDTCPMGCTEGAGCDAYSYSNETCPTDGSACASEDNGTSGCCANNSVWECYGNTYHVTHCSDLNSALYCDEQAEFQYAQCVLGGDEEDANRYVSYGNCYNLTDGTLLEMYACVMGDSGKYGEFGGYFVKSICAGSTKALSCDGVSSGSSPNILSCTTCTSGKENNYTTATCQ